MDFKTNDNSQPFKFIDHDIKGSTLWVCVEDGIQETYSPDLDCVNRFFLKLNQDEQEWDETVQWLKVLSYSIQHMACILKSIHSKANLLLRFRELSIVKCWSRVGNEITNRKVLPNFLPKRQTVEIKQSKKMRVWEPMYTAERIILQIWAILTWGCVPWSFKQ